MSAVSTPADLISRAAVQQADLAILDLSLTGLDARQVVDELRALNKPPHAILAHAPHVHEAKLAAARDAGCDQVLSQGGFHREIGGILDQLSSSL